MTKAITTSEQGWSVAERVAAAREQAGLSLDDAAAATGLLRSYLSALETGRRRPLPREVERLSRAYDVDLSDLLPGRRPVEVDTGRVVVGGHERQVRDLADDRDVYAAYLFLLCAVRGAQPGERIPLRSSDVERLMAVVGEDAVTIERRLVELMGCTPAEATRLRRALLRHRTAAVVVAAAALTVAAAPIAPQVSAGPAGSVASAQPLSGGASAASYFPGDGLEGDTVDALPVQDVLDGTWSPSYPSVDPETTAVDD